MREKLTNMRIEQTFCQTGTTQTSVKKLVKV